jgi:hypothetical protein
LILAVVLGAGELLDLLTDRPQPVAHQERLPEEVVEGMGPVDTAGGSWRTPPDAG